MYFSDIILKNKKRVEMKQKESLKKRKKIVESSDMIILSMILSLAAGFAYLTIVSPIL